MKDEIKEILELLKEDLYIPQEDNREYKLLDKGDDKLLLDYITNLQQENKQLKERIDKLDNYIEQIRKMLYKRHLGDYDIYTANVLCDMQSEFEEILRGE